MTDRGSAEAGERVVTCYYGILSPFTYLGMPRLKAICVRHGVPLLYRPTDFFAVFKVSGGVPLEARAPQRRKYRLLELRRWGEYLGLPINPEPRYFPCDMTPASLLVLAAQAQGAYEGDLSFALERAVWAEERDIADPGTLVDIANAQGFDGAALYAASREPAIAARYAANTRRAIELDMFGSPTYEYRGEIFWGQDRLDLLDWTLGRG